MNRHTIRKAEPPDVAEIQRLYDELDAHHVRLLPHIFRDARRARPDSLVEATIAGADSDCLVALLDGRVVGFLEIKEEGAPEYPMFIPRRFAFIDNMVVEEIHRGEGFGTMLLDAARAWAKARDLESIQLTVWFANEDVIRLYENRGYVSIMQRMELTL